MLRSDGRRTVAEERKAEITDTTVWAGVSWERAIDESGAEIRWLQFQSIQHGFPIYVCNFNFLPMSLPLPFPLASFHSFYPNTYSSICWVTIPFFFFLNILFICVFSPSGRPGLLSLDLDAHAFSLIYFLSYVIVLLYNLFYHHPCFLY